MFLYAHVLPTDCAMSKSFLACLTDPFHILSISAIFLLTIFIDFLIEILVT